MAQQNAATSYSVVIASDQPPIPGMSGAQYTSVAGAQQIALGASTALAVPGGATMARLNVEGGWLRYYDDGTIPTGTLGMLYGPGETFWAPTNNLNAIRVAKDSGSTSATLNVSYYRV